jgi:glutathione S-transferase
MANEYFVVFLTPPPFLKSKLWMDRKVELRSGTDVPFPNLPFMLDATQKGVKPVALVQTRAILRHIGRKYNLLGDDVDVFDMLLDECTDFDDVLTGLSYRNCAAFKNAFEEQLKPKLDDFASHLENTGPFLTGANPSVVDFKFFDTLSKLKVAEKEAGTQVVSSNVGITEYITRVAALPAIAAYLASSAFIDRPL